MKLEQLNEATKKKVIIAEGPAKGQKGTMVFNKLMGDLRYYVIELDNTHAKQPVVVVYNGEFDWA